MNVQKKNSLQGMCTSVPAFSPLSPPVLLHIPLIFLEVVLLALSYICCHVAFQSLLERMEHQWLDCQSLVLTAPPFMACSTCLLTSAMDWMLSRTLSLVPVRPAYRLIKPHTGEAFYSCHHLCSLLTTHEPVLQGVKAYTAVPSF